MAGIRVWKMDYEGLEDVEKEYAGLEDTRLNDEGVKEGG
jgi:hypothetical protein